MESFSNSMVRFFIEKEREDLLDDLKMNKITVVLDYFELSFDKKKFIEESEKNRKNLLNFIRIAMESYRKDLNYLFGKYENLKKYENDIYFRENSSFLFRINIAKLFLKMIRKNIDNNEESNVFLRCSNFYYSYFILAELVDKLTILSKILESVNIDIDPFDSFNQFITFDFSSYEDELKKEEDDENEDKDENEEDEEEIDDELIKDFGEKKERKNMMVYDESSDEDITEDFL